MLSALSLSLFVPSGLAEHRMSNEGSWGFVLSRKKMNLNLQQMLFRHIHGPAYMHLNVSDLELLLSSGCQGIPVLLPLPSV